MMIVGVDVRSLMEGRHSGVEEYAVKIIRTMVEQAPQYTWVLFYNSWKKITLPDFGTKVRVVSFRYPNKLFNLCQFAFNRPRWDKMIERQARVKMDVIFVPNARLMPVVNTPLVVTVHDLSYELFPEFYSWRRRLWHKFMKPKRLVTKAARVIAVSQATKDDLVRLYQLSPNRVSVVYSGAEATKDNRQSDEYAAGNPLTPHNHWPEKFILYLGTLEPRKNIVSIIEAFTAIAAEIPHHLVIAGEKGWLGGEIRRAVKKSTAKDKIHQIGYVTQAEKQALYSAADIFIYPSFYEGFGFPPLEALLAGTPVIISNNSSLPEVAGEFAIMVNPYDVAELALVVKELLRDLPKITPDVRRRIEQKFSWRVAAGQTAAVLEQVGQGK